MDNGVIDGNAGRRHASARQFCQRAGVYKQGLAAPFDSRAVIMPCAYAIILPALEKGVGDRRLVAVISRNPFPFKRKREEIPEFIFTESVLLFVLQVEKYVARVIAEKKLHGTVQLLIQLQGKWRHDIAAMDDETHLCAPRKAKLPSARARPGHEYPK